MKLIHDIVDHDNGVGFAIRGMPDTFFPNTFGLGIVHDLMEHFEHDGSLESEFMAFGCMLWGRGEGGYWYQRATGLSKLNSFADQVASDFMGMYQDWSEGNSSELRTLGEDKRWFRFLRDNEGSLEEHTLQTFAEVADACRAMITRDADELDIDTEKYDVEQFVNTLIDWMKVGYLRADKRGVATNTSPDIFVHLFMSLQDQLDEAFNKPSLFYSGSTVKLIVYYDAGKRRVGGEMYDPWYESELKDTFLAY